MPDAVILLLASLLRVLFSMPVTSIGKRTASAAPPPARKPSPTKNKKAALVKRFNQTVNVEVDKQQGAEDTMLIRGVPREEHEITDIDMGITTRRAQLTGAASMAERKLEALKQSIREERSKRQMLLQIYHENEAVLAKLQAVNRELMHQVALLKSGTLTARMLGGRAIDVD